MLVDQAGAGRHGHGASAPSGLSGPLLGDQWCNTLRCLFRQHTMHLLRAATSLWNLALWSDQTPRIQGFQSPHASAACVREHTLRGCQAMQGIKLLLSLVTQATSTVLATV